MAFFYTKSIYALLFIVLSVIVYPRPIVLLWFFGAMVWGLGHQWCWAERGMPNDQVIPKAMLEGRIVSIPNQTATKSQFQFSLTRLNDQRVRSRILLTCYNRCPSFNLGDVWRFQAKLKRPKNLGNPGHFDYVSWLHAKHIYWTGYIRPQMALRGRHTEASYSLLKFREQVALAWKDKFSSPVVQGVFEALTMGMTHHLDKPLWDLFRRTGTTHLMVISGAHVGLVAGLSFGLMSRIWSRCSALCLRYPAIQVASVISLIVALLYGLLSGFGGSVQRALMACFFLFSKYFLSYRCTRWQAWRYSLLAVLLFEPHTVLSPGFYLSFLAVAILFLVNQRVRATGFIKAIFMQIGCLVGLMPLTMHWFSYGSINGFLANLFAIPWVSFVIVPLSLISLCIVPLWPSPLFLSVVSFAIDILMKVLDAVDALSFVNVQGSLNSVLPVLSLMLVMLVGLFFPVKASYPALFVFVMTSLFPGYPSIKPNEADVTVLDVGQGLSVVVRTAKHVLVYDTGMKFYQGEDMAKLAILPYLRQLGIKKLDKIIISHPDLDHRGGLVSLQDKYTSAELVVNDPLFYHRGSDCHVYPDWEWDGVMFHFLPIHKPFYSQNNRSCVLKISTRKGSVLLTGDIEKNAEQELVREYGDALKANALVVPHHGSKTSSSVLFIKHVAPEFAVISAGFDNRFHFPHPKTLSTLEEEHVKIVTTMGSGMVTLSLKDRKPVEVSTYYDKMGAF